MGHSWSGEISHTHPQLLQVTFTILQRMQNAVGLLMFWVVAGVVTELLKIGF
jgi:hypothetical protein